LRTELAVDGFKRGSADRVAVLAGKPSRAWWATQSVVAVGTSAHQEVLEMVAPKSLAILCEKPIAPTIAGTLEAIELVEKNGSSLQIGFQRRFDEPIKAMQQKVASGEVGTIYALNMTAHDKTPSE
jgi:myo-inositol 2-dehydrogenase/D-chiro-inositol 1-dehydrogenase